MARNASDDQQDAGVAAPVRGLAGRVGQHEVDGRRRSGTARSGPCGCRSAGRAWSAAAARPARSAAEAPRRPTRRARPTGATAPSSKTRAPPHDGPDVHGRRAAPRALRVPDVSEERARLVGREDLQPPCADRSAGAARERPGVHDAEHGGSRAAVSRPAGRSARGSRCRAWRGRRPAGGGASPTRRRGTRAACRPARCGW